MIWVGRVQEKVRGGSYVLGIGRGDGLSIED